MERACVYYVVRNGTMNAIQAFIFIYLFIQQAVQCFHIFLRPFNIFFFFAVALRPNAGHGRLIHKVSRSHTTTHHSRQGSSGRVISSSQSPLPRNTHHSQQTNIHAPGGIRTHDFSRRAAADRSPQTARPLGPAFNIFKSSKISKHKKHPQISGSSSQLSVPSLYQNVWERCWERSTVNRTMSVACTGNNLCAKVRVSRRKYSCISCLYHVADQIMFWFYGKR